MRSRSRVVEAAVVGGVLLAVMLLRVFYLNAYLSEIPNATTPSNDARMYWEMGRDVYQKGWLLRGEGPYYQAPLYPYGLAMLHHLGIHSLEAVLRLQALLGVLSIFLTYLLVRFTLPMRWAAGAALLYGLCHYPLFFESKVLAAALGSTLFMTFAVLYAMWIRSSRVVWLVASAFTYGLAIVCRANLLFALPFILLHAAGPWRTSVSSRQAFIKAANRSFAFLLVFLISASPVPLRNYFVGGDLVPISANSGVTLYMGTNDRAEGGLAPVEGLSNDIALQKEGSIALASQLAGEDFSPSQASSFWVRKTASWILRNPARYISLEAKKLMWALYAAPPAVNYSAHFEGQWFASLNGLSVITAFTLFMGLAGLPVLLFKRTRTESFLICLIGGYIALSLVFYASDRFLASTLPFLTAVGGCAAKRLWDARGEIVGNNKTVYALIVWAVISAMLAWNPFLGWNAEREIGMGWYNLGVFYSERGQSGEALQAYEKAKMHITDFPPLLLNLGVIYARRGDLVESTRLFERALQLDPNNQQARKNLSINRERMRR